MTFTDYLGNPISEGDIVIYPQHAGSSSARIQMSRVVEIDPIIKDHSGTYFKSQERRSSRSTPTYPTKYVPTGPGRDDVQRVDDPTLAYALKVQRLKFNIRTGQWEDETELDYGASREASPNGKFDRKYADTWVYRTVKTSRIINVDRVTVITSLVP